MQMELSPPKHWRYGTTRVCCSGWRSPTLDRSGFAGPNIFATQGTQTPHALLLRAFAGGELLYSTFLFFLLPFTPLAASAPAE